MTPYDKEILCGPNLSLPHGIREKNNEQKTQFIGFSHVKIQ